MLSAQEIIREAEALPVEEREMIVGSLLRTLGRADPEIDRAWLEVASRRLDDLDSGRVKPVPGEAVFQRLWKRFDR